MSPVEPQGETEAIASGNLVHILLLLRWNRPDAAFDWTERFDEAVVRQLADAPGDALKLAEHPDYQAAAPRPDHFIPLLYLAGLAAAQDAALDPLVRGYAMGSISITCYGLDAGLGLAGAEAEGAATIPEGVSAEQTNI